MTDEKFAYVGPQDRSLRNSDLGKSDGDIDEVPDNDNIAPEAAICWYNGQSFNRGDRICVRQNGQALGDLYICVHPGEWKRGGACQ